MGVISPNGVVGIVLNVSTHFATIQSVLHSDTRISAALEHSEAFGSLVWGDNIDARYGMLRDIPNHVEVEVGERVYTSGFSLFPPGIQVGTVFETGLAGGESFLDIKVELSTNFHNIQHVEEERPPADKQHDHQPVDQRHDAVHFGGMCRRRNRQPEHVEH